MFWRKRSRAERDLDEELRFHVEAQTRENIARGMTPAEARRQALLELGGVEQVKESVRDIRPGAWLETVWQDIRYGARMLRRSPGFTAVAVLTLALGIGANTAVFSVVRGVLLNPLPYDDPGRLVSVGSEWRGFTHSSVSEPEYFDYREQVQAFEEIGIYRRPSINLTEGAGEPERVAGALVSASLFDVLGREPLLGRTFRPEENLPGNQRVLVLSYGLWQRRFAGDPDIIGRKFSLHAETHEVVGVMPADFYFPDREVQLWAPLVLDRPNLSNRGAHNRQVIARLKPGVTLAAAQAEMDGIARRLAEQYPRNYPQGSGWGISLYTLGERVVGHVRQALLVLLGAVGLLLLVACANVANLLLARAAARDREMAVRAALGAHPRRLARQVLTESLLLAAAGAAAGVLLAAWLVQAFRGLALDQLPRMDEVGLDTAVLAYSGGLALVTGALFGLWPARAAARRNLRAALQEGARGSAGGAGGTQRALVVTQVALALVLLAGAGLFLRSFDRLLRVDPGLDPRNVLTTRITPAPGKYDEQHQQVAFYRALLERLQARPDVVAAGAVSILPFSGSDTDFGLGIEDWVPPSPGMKSNEQARIVGGQYFRALAIPLLAGRVFDERDTGESAPVVVVSESFAGKYWPGQNALGRRIKLWGLDAEGPWRTVVGVVGDVRHFGVAEPVKPFIYFPQTQHVQRTMTVVARLTVAPAAARSMVGSAVQELDREQPVYAVKTMEEYLAESVARPQFNLAVMGAFAVLAVLLAAVGLYGVMAYAVAQRTREIGIRMALGAERGDVFRMVVGRGMLLVAAGVALGLAGALAVTRVLEGQLFGVAPHDPLTFAGVALLLTVVALAACYIPARRAMRVEPVEALRHE